MKQYNFSPLEERVVLDAAVGAALAADLSHQSNTEGGAPTTTVTSTTTEVHTSSDTANNGTHHESNDQAASATTNVSDSSHAAATPAATDPLGHAADPLKATADPLKVLVVDNSIENYTQLVNSAADNVKVVIYDSKTTTLDGLYQKIKDALGGKQADSIAFAMEGRDNYIKVTDAVTINQETVQTQQVQTFFGNLGDLIKDGGRLDLLTSNLTQYTSQLVDSIDGLLDNAGHAVDVAASNNATGSTGTGADWTLERGNIDALQYFNSNINNWDGHLTNLGMTNTQSAAPATTDVATTTDTTTSSDTTNHDSSVQITSTTTTVDTSHTSDDPLGHPGDPLQATTDPVKVLVIDNSIENYTQLVNSTADNVKVIIYDSKTTTLDGLYQKIKDALGGKQADSIAFAMEGQDNYIRVTDSLVINQDNVQTQPVQTFFGNLGELIKNGGRLDLLTCNLTEYSSRLVDTIDGLLDSAGHSVNVAASNDATGNAFIGGDWTLERGNVDALQYFNANINNWNGHLATFVVTNVNDSGAGSLRSAITNANTTVGDDTITFNIAGAGIKTITLLSTLTISDSVNIDATTQTGYVSSPLIELNGNNGAVSDAFNITSVAGTTVTISGFSIGGFGDHGITGTTITRTVNITDNYIGLSAAGAVRSNGTAGIELAGGTLNISDNVISGNFGMGIYLNGTTTAVNITDNLIGTTADGSAALGEYQGYAGIRVRLNPLADLLIDGNTISGNGNGIVFETQSNTNFVVSHNRIGTALNGSTLIGNWGSGILFGSPDAPISNFPEASAGVISANTIAGNGTYGIWFTEDGSDSMVEITQNRIFSNGSSGIEMGAPGPNVNDALDADTGNNSNQNTANLVITSPVSGGTYGVGGTLSSAANHTYRIEFFGSGTNDAFGYGEGVNYLGFLNVTTNASGLANIATQTFNASTGAWVSATVTDTTAAQAFTSEFSRSVNINPNVLFLSDGVFTEPGSGTVNGTILLTLSSAATSAFTVNLAATNGTAGAADYALLTNSVTFAVGDTQKLISVQIKSDTLNEATETFTINATTTAPGITINGGTATVFIIDNSAAGVISPFTLRYSAIAKGDMTAIGNVNIAPYDNTIAASGLTNNNISQVYVDVDSNNTTFNSSSAVLSIGSGSTVLFAGLYWSGYQDGNHNYGALPNVDSSLIGQVLFKTPTGTYVAINASTLRVDYNSAFGGSAYTAFADVTSLVAGATGGSGNYFVGNIQTTPGYSVIGTTGNWSLLVVYGNSAQPTRSFSVYDGLVFAGVAGPVSIPIAGFKTPTTGALDADLIISAQDGEGSVDSVRINSTSSATGTAISDPSGEILNSRITYHGTNVTNRNINAFDTFGFDLRTVDVSSYLTNGQTSTNFFINPGSDNLYVNLLAFSTTLYSADINVTTTATDVNGGTLHGGDVVQYVVTVTNAGQDNAIQTILRDVIPTFTTYVAGSLVVVSGSNTGSKTDGTGDDVAFFDTANNRVVFNLGSGATSTAGGTLAPGATTVIRFRVIVDANIADQTVIPDTATVNYKSQDINAALVDSGSVSVTANNVPAISINDVTVTEGNSGTSTATFTITLSNASTQNVTINYSTGDGSATIADGDYIALGSTLLTFTPGQTSKTVTVTVNGDNFFEGNETFFVNLATAVNATILDAQGVGTITNDDAAPALVITPIDTITSEGGDQANFTVALSSAPRTNVTVNIVSSDPTEGVPAITTLIFTAANWNIPQAVTVNGVDDNIVDGTISYNMNLTTTSADPNFNGVTGTTALTNLDNDVANINIDNVSVTEGNTGTSLATFTVTLSNASDSTVTINYSTSDGTATTADNDYQGIGLTPLVFAAGETSKTISVIINGDNFNEGNETFTVNLADAVNGTIVVGTGTGTIINDDNSTPGVSIVPSASGGGNTTTSENGDTASFDITLTSAPRSPVTVSITTSDPTEGLPNVTTLTFDSSNWNVAQTIIITGQDDNVVDGNIAYTINTTSTSADADFNGLLNFSIPLTNVDNDAANITIDNVSLVEGNSGTSIMTFTVSLSTASTSTVTVDYNTADGTATTGDNDYNAVGLNTLTFLAGETSKTISVTINGDNYFESNETYNVNLSNAVGGTIADATGVGTIINDDATGPNGPGAIIILPGGDGSTGTTSENGDTGTFTIQLSSAPRSPVTITFTSTDPTEGTVITLPVTFDDTNWNVPQTITIQGADDNIVDGTIAYQITGTLSSSDPVYNGQITAPINFENTDNDTANISINNVSVIEGNSGTTTMTFTVTLSNASTSTVTVDYNTLDGTATTGDNDYNGLPLTTLQFLAGETSKQITVTINGDNFLENNENFSVILTNATGGTIVSDTGTGTIINDDAAGGVVVIPPSSPSDTTTGEDGTQGFFSVSLSSAPRDTVTLTFSSSDPSEGVPAVTSITFDSTNWNTPQTVFVNGVDDTIVDGNVAYNIVTQMTSNDANFNNVALAPIQFTNLDNDVANISVSNITLVEGNTGTATGTFTVTLSNSSLSTVTVNYSLGDGTATAADHDYIPILPGTLTFNPGEMVKTVTFLANGDYYYETNESVLLTLSGSNNGTILTNTATASIVNDDAVPQIIVTPVDTVTDPAHPTGSITITLTSKPRDPITVVISTSDPSQGTPDVPSVTIDGDNWQTPVIVTITGNGSESAQGGNIPFTITTTPISNDPFFGNLPPQDTTFVNTRPQLVAAPPQNDPTIRDPFEYGKDNSDKVISFESTLGYGTLGTGFIDLNSRYDFNNWDFNNNYQFYGMRDLNNLERDYLFDRANKFASDDDDSSSIAPLWGIDGTQGRLFAFKDPNNLMGSYISYGDLTYTNPKDGSSVKVAGNISSFAIDSDNTAYLVINSDLGGVKGPVLAKIDLNHISKTGNNLQIVGSVGGKNITGIAFDKESGYLYGIERQANADVLKIYNKDNGYGIEIGALKDINNTPYRAEDLKFDENGDLYATGPNEKLFLINRSSGTTKPIDGDAYHPSALAFDKSNEMLMVVGDDSVSYYQHKVLNHEVKIDAKALGLSSIDGLNFIDPSKK